MKRFDDISDYIKRPKGVKFVNSIIVDVDVEWNTHFNIIYPMIKVKDDDCDFQLFSDRNLTGATGEVMRHIYECIVGNYRGDIISFRKNMVGTPIRLAYEGNDLLYAKLSGIGHFMEDKFIFFDQYYELLKEER